jgi:colicin import membrane protein
MKATEVQGQPIDSVKEPFAAYLALSAAVHGTLVVCAVAGAWWLGAPAYYKPSSYTVSLVDAPLTLRKPPPPIQSQTPSETPQPGLHQPTPMPTPVAPEPPPDQRAAAPTKAAAAPPAPNSTTTTQAMTVPQSNPPKVAPAPPPAKTAKTTRAPQKKPSKAVSPAPPQTAARPPSKRSKPTSATAAEARRAVTTLRQRQAETASGTTQAQQRAAEQRLASLRARFGSNVTGNVDATAGLQQVRLRAYQELVRQRIIDAWILPLPQEEARNLQATALLTVGRNGHIAQLNLLKTSGNPLFDDSLLRAIKQAAPLPALPEDYGG